MILFALMAVDDIHDKNIPLLGLPYIVKQALGSTVGNIFLIDSAIAITVCCLAVHTSCIRMMFAMARDGRLPFGPQVARVSGRGKVPIVPAIVVGLFAILLLAINIGNQSAFLALTSVAIIMFYLAYLCVTGPLLLRRLRGTWPTPEHGTYFSLGRWGVLVNVFAVVYGAIVAFNIAWPRTDVYNAIGPHHWYFQWAAYLFIGAVMGSERSTTSPSTTASRSRSSPSTASPVRPRRAGDLQRGAVIAEGEFDYVIAGGGTAGCVVAARLSEDPDVSVCLLEAGPSDVDDAAILRLEDWMYLLDSGYDWDYLVEPQEKGNSFLRHARAKVLGGCSSHNSCIAFWTPREDLDEWAATGCTGWSADECWPLIKRLETNDAPGDHHGRSGPVNIRTVPPNDPCGVAVLEAAAQAGLPTSQFNAGHTVTNGAGWFQINSGPDNTRMSSSHAYLHPILGSRPNLTVRTGVWASRIVLDDQRRATGVGYLTPDLLTHAVASARREVIVSAGAIDTPKLLMLSGIGPGAHLQEFGIDVVADSPGVGANLDDHVEGIVQWDAAKPMIRTSTQWWEIGLFSTSEPGLDRPDLMMHYGSVPFDMNTMRWGYPTTENGFCLTPNVCRGRSRGTVRLRTRDYRDRARVDPRYFTDPEGHDEQVMLYGVKLARKIVSQPAMAEWAARELAPGPDAVSDDELIDYIHKTHNTVYHPACTAHMGPDSDPEAVVDPRLRVRGVQGLRVADGSIMPFLPAINPCITTMMIGEKCADMLIQDARSAQPSSEALARG